ncbi:MAG: hypothetical protein J0H81_07355 [Sphingopyxis terrae]|nr:hypothetical protein [Sphingopyxis terrae]
MSDIFESKIVRAAGKLPKLDPEIEAETVASVDVENLEANLIGRARSYDRMTFARKRPLEYRAQ